MRAEVSTTEDGRTAIVSAVGEVDLATAPRLREALSDALALGIDELLMDLRQVTFIDSTGLGVLIGAGKKVYGRGGTPRIVCDNKRVLRLLAITGISRSIPVVATPDGAFPRVDGALSGSDG